MLMHFNHKHLSVDSFEDVNLEDLTVITGVNGSGKTHLLDAVASGAVTIGNISKYGIVRFDYESFKLENESSHTAHQLNVDKNNAWTYLQGFHNGMNAHLKSKIGALAFERSKRSEDTIFWDVKNDQIAEEYRNAVYSYFRQTSISQQPWSGSLLNYIKSANAPSIYISKEEFILTYRPSTYKNDFLAQTLGAIVWDYYIRYMQNEVNKLQREKSFIYFEYFTAEEFEAKNGEKPWIVINRILRGFGTLDYEITSPEGEDLFSSFHLQLCHTTKSDLKIEFSNLSSGERILMALVASVYKYASEKSFPELLLLDELDATLHPSMMRNMLGIIKDVFLVRGTKVILVTHSPSTVALSEDRSILVMKKAGFERFEKTERKAALSILTEGFATLEEGMLLFDQASKKRICIISEGRNTKLLACALNHYHVAGVEIINGAEAISGKTQLKTLYDFFCKIPHSSKVIFVWDADATYNLLGENNTYPFIFRRNSANQIARTGIENLYNADLFGEFQKKIILSNKEVIVEFDESRKKDFESFIIGRDKKDDFWLFEPLMKRIEEIRTL